MKVEKNINLKDITTVLGDCKVTSIENGIPYTKVPYIVVHDVLMVLNKVAKLEKAEVDSLNYAMVENTKFFDRLYGTITFDNVERFVRAECNIDNFDKSEQFEIMASVGMILTQFVSTMYKYIGTYHE